MILKYFIQSVWLLKLCIESFAAVVTSVDYTFALYLSEEHKK